MKRISSLNLMCLLVGLSYHVAASAATYYVSSSLGSDVNTGTSPDAPWQSISKVNHGNFSTGDKVYFLVGDEWDNEFLIVKWSGTVDSHAVIGAYHVKSNGEVAYDSGTGNRRPIIDDHYEWGAKRFTAATGSNPGINVSGSYVDIENIEVKQSGWGIRVKGNSQTHVTLTNVFVNGAYQCGIQANG